MNRIKKSLMFSGLAIVTLGTVLAQGQRKPPTPVQSVTGNFTSVNSRLLEMAKDFPEDKYDFRPTPEVRSFGDIIIHVTSGNVYAAKAGRGEQVQWEELDAKKYKGKAEMVAALQKSIDDATATLKALPPEHFTQTISPWMGVIEHAAEHYGQLVVYYRLNSLVPPESRPKTK